MKKNKFLNGLRDALAGELSPNEINQQLLYYERYIEDEIAKGKTEEEVMDLLGEPRLIAKTIIDSNEINMENAKEYYDTREESTGKETSKTQMNIKGTWSVVKVILIILIVFAVVFGIIRLLLPVLVPILIIWIIFSWIKKK